MSWLRPWKTTSTTMIPSLSVRPAEWPCRAIASASSLCSSVTRCCIRSQGASASSVVLQRRVDRPGQDHGGSWRPRLGRVGNFQLRQGDPQHPGRGEGLELGDGRVAHPGRLLDLGAQRVPCPLGVAAVADRLLLELAGCPLVGVAAFGVPAELVQLPVQLLDRSTGGLQQSLIERLGGGRLSPAAAARSAASVRRCSVSASSSAASAARWRAVSNASAAGHSPASATR